jgi:hypothetical protein
MAGGPNGDPGGDPGGDPDGDPGGDPDDPDNEPGTPIPYDGPIDYRVTGGFGGQGDGTVPLHIDPDGTATKGETTVTLPPSVMADVYQKAAAARFATLEPTYVCDCSDDYVHIVTVELDGTPRTVEVHGMARPPEALKVMIDTLHGIAGPRLSSTVAQ